MRTSKKLLSLFLAVVMVVTTCSVGFTAFAQDNRNSIWNTSSEAQDAFDTLDGIANEYLPSILLGIGAIGDPIFEKRAKELGKTAEELTEAEREEIANSTTLTDVLYALQPMLLELLEGTKQEEFVDTYFTGTKSSRFDFLNTDSTMSYFTIVALCDKYSKDFGGNPLSAKERKQLQEVYDQLMPIAEAVTALENRIKEFGARYDEVMPTGEDYLTAPLYGLETFDYKLSDEDQEFLASIYPSYNKQLESYHVPAADITIDNVGELLYYFFGAGKDLLTAYYYDNLIREVADTVSFKGEADGLSIELVTNFNITDIKPGEYADVIAVQMFLDSEMASVYAPDVEGNDRGYVYVSYKYDDNGDQVFDAQGNPVLVDENNNQYSFSDIDVRKGAVDIFGSSTAELTDSYLELNYSYLKAYAIPFYLNGVLKANYINALSGMAIQSGAVASKTELDSMVKEIMPNGWTEEACALSENDIRIMTLAFKEMLSGSNKEEYVEKINLFFSGETLQCTIPLRYDLVCPESVLNTAFADYLQAFLLEALEDGSLENTLGEMLKTFHPQYFNLNNFYVTVDGQPPNSQLSNVKVDENGIPELNYTDYSPIYGSVNGKDEEGNIETSINGFMARAEIYAYSKVVSELLEITDFESDETTHVDFVIDVPAYIEKKMDESSSGAEATLTEEQIALIESVDFTNDIGAAIINKSLNDTIIGLLDTDLMGKKLSELINGLLETDVELETALKDLWSTDRLLDSPIGTIVELLPVIVVVLDDLILPFIINGQGDQYNNTLMGVVGNTLLKDYITASGSYIGIDTTSWDLNTLLPNLMHWLLEGADAAGIEYYNLGTVAVKVLEGTEYVTKLTPAGEVNTADVRNYKVVDQNGNELVRVDGEDATTFTYMGKTSEDMDEVLADYPDSVFTYYMTYEDNVPYLTGIYLADKALRDASIADLEGMLGKALGATAGPILYEVIVEIATLFTESVDTFVNTPELRNETRYDKSGQRLYSGLNNIFVALPQLFDIMENLAADKYGVAQDEWVYCYEGKLVRAENGNLKNTSLETFKSFAGSTDKNRKVDILDCFAGIFVEEWLNAIVSLLNNVISTDNEIANNLPIVSGLLNALGGLGEQSIITDILNGVFQLDRESKFSFTFEKRANGLTGLTKDHAYFLITNVKTLIEVVTNLIANFGSGSSVSAAGGINSLAATAASNSPVYKPKAATTAKASSANYSAAELSNAADLINNLDKMLSSLLSDSTFNGFNLSETDNILASLVTFFTNYLGRDCYNNIMRLVNIYVYYITGQETQTADKNGNVKDKDVYTNESLTTVVVETFRLIEDIAEDLLKNFYDTYELENGSSAQYNLLVEAIEGLISPDAIAIRLDGYDDAQKKLDKYNCWHNAAETTARGKLKVNIDWGIKDGDKTAFFNGLASSLRLVTSILSVLLIDTGWYGSVLMPVLGAFCTPNGIKIDSAKEYEKLTNGYHDEALLGIMRPVSEWLNAFLSKPATTLIKTIQGLAGVLDDSSGATIKSILTGVRTPLVREIRGLGNIFGITSDKLLATSPSLQALLNGVANELSDILNADTIKLGNGNYRYSLSGKNLIPIINSYIASTGITLKQIDWAKLSKANSPAAALVYVLEYVIEVLLENENLAALIKLINNDVATMIIDALKSGKVNAKDLLSVLNTILEVTDSPTLVYWTFAQYLQEALESFKYPMGITKEMADNGVNQLNSAVGSVLSLLGSFGVDLGGDNLQDIINNKLFTNELLTKLATALYGALDGLDPTIKTVLSSLGIVSSTKDVAKLLTDSSYGKTYTSAANTIKAQSNWKNVKNVNWGFTDGTDAAQQGFVNALAAILRPLNSVLDVFLNEGTLELSDTAYEAICLIDVKTTVKYITISDDKDKPIKAKLTYSMKNGVLTLGVREDPNNRDYSRTSTLKVDFTSLKTLNDLKIEGTNGYNSAIIPLLEALQCSDVDTYAQYRRDVANAKDNLLLDILNPLVGNSSSSFLNKLCANPVKELAVLLPNVAMYLDAHGLSQLVSNLIAPVTNIVYALADVVDVDAIIEAIAGKSLDELISGLIGLKEGTLNINLKDLTTLNLEDAIIPIVNYILKSKNIDIELPDINWNMLISLGSEETYESKATGSDGDFLTGKRVGNIDQGKVLITVLRYVANVLINNHTSLKDLICSIDGIKNSKQADLIISILQSVFNTIGTASADEIVAAVFYLLAGEPENAFWDYTKYETGKYTFTYPESVDTDFLVSLPPMLDGLIGSLLDLNETISKALFKDELISKLAKGLYGAVEGVKINDNTNLTSLLAQTNIDFSTANVAKLLVDKDYGQTFENAASVIRSAGSWKNVNVESLKWGVTDRDSFFHALVAVLRPIYGVLDVLLNDASLGIFDIVRIPGSNGYTSSIVPLMEAFSMYNIKTQYQYREDINKEYDAILLDIINPIWDKVEDILAAPLQTVAAVLPNLALFIGNDGLCQILDNMLTPISALLDSIRPIVDLNDLLPSILSALNVDLNSLLGKIGIKNFKLDIYDINKTLKPVLGGDAIIPLVNNILGMIDIKGTKLNIKLNAVDWLQLASHGTTIVSASQAPTYGARIFVDGDSSETLIAVLRYLIDTVNAGGNFDAICGLIGGLLGDGVADNITDMINTVLGMLQGETDQVISDLVGLLQEIAG